MKKTLIATLLTLFFSMGAYASIINFNITGGNITIQTDPSGNIATDEGGIFGSVGNQYIVDNMILTAIAGSGFIDDGNRILDYTVSFNGTYDVYDLSRVLVQQVNFQLIGLHEIGILDVNGIGQMNAAPVQSIGGLPAFMAREDNRKSPNIPIYLNGNLISIDYISPPLLNEMTLTFDSNFGDAAINGTAAGTLNTQIVSSPPTILLALSGLLGLWGSRRRENHLGLWFAFQTVPVRSVFWQRGRSHRALQRPL